MPWAFRQLNKKFIKGGVRSYQLFISPIIHTLAGPGSGCRFHPTCSEYISEALVSHGWLQGGALSLRRLARCQPWGPMGSDPVPTARSPILLHRKGN
jgi:uncharacterized protein